MASDDHPLPGLLRLPDEALRSSLGFLDVRSVGRAASSCRRMRDAADHDRLWSSLAEHCLPRGESTYLRAAATHSGAPERPWRATLRQWHDVVDAWDTHRPASRIAANAVPMSSGPVFGMCLFAAGRPSEASAALRADTYLAATADGSIKVVSSRGGSAVDLYNPAPDARGYLGFAFDPRSSVAVTGGFNGAVDVLSVHFDEREELEVLPVRRLKAILTSRGVSTDGCFEKADLIRRIRATHSLPPLRHRCTLTRHGGTVPGCSVDGNWVASGGNDGLARLFDLRRPDAERQVFEWNNAGVPVDIVQVEPTAGRVFLGDKANTTCVFDMHTGARVHRFTPPGDGWVWCICTRDTAFDAYLGPRTPPEDLWTTASGARSSSGGGGGGGSGGGGGGGGGGSGIRGRDEARDTSAVMDTGFLLGGGTRTAPWDRMFLTAGTDGLVRLWDLRSETEVGMYLAIEDSTLRSGPVAGLQANLDRHTIVAASFLHQVFVLDIRATKRPLEVVSAPSAEERRTAVETATRVSGGALRSRDTSVSDDSAAATATTATAAAEAAGHGSDGPVFRWTMSSKRALRHPRLTDRCTRLAIGPNSLATGCFNGESFVWSFDGAGMWGSSAP